MVKRKLRNTVSMFLLLVFPLLFSVVHGESTPPLIVQELIDIVQLNNSFRNELDNCFKEFSPKKPHTFNDYYAMWTEFLTWMPPSNNAWKYGNVINEMAQFSPVCWQLMREFPLHDWMMRFLDTRGAFLWSTASKPIVSNWTADPKIQIEDYIIPPGGFASFNQFFTRHIKLKLRPLPSPADDRVIVSPCDSMVEVLKGYLSVTETKFLIKGQKIGVDALLSNDKWATEFEGGQAAVLFLDGFNYHRWNAPVDGIIAAAYEVGGSYWFPNNLTSYWDFLHRGVIIYKTESFGYVAMCPIGMVAVGSVNLYVHEGQHVNKGDEVGYFAMGGSSMVLLFQKDFPVQFSVKRYNTLFVRQEIATFTQPQSKYSLVVQELIDMTTLNTTLRDLSEKCLTDSGHGPNSHHPRSLVDIQNFWQGFLTWLPPSNNAFLPNNVISEYLNTPTCWELMSKEPLRDWVVRFLDARAAFLWSPESKGIVSNWTNNPQLNISDYIIPPGGFQSFNAFFTRHIKPSLRPIASPTDDYVVDSPCDGFFIQYHTPLDLHSKFELKNTIVDIDTVMSNKQWSSKFTGGTTVVLVLAGFNYHRWNSPVNGKIVEQYEIGGEYWLNQYSWNHGYWDYMHRACIIYDSPKLGLVAMLPIGMVSVGSVNLEKQIGDDVKKGEEVGYFAMGGSSMILIFQKDVQLNFSVPLNSTLDINSKFATMHHSGWSANVRHPNV